ncbi:uncharacterized protein G2W53_008708 [Senna tora]|uniref:Uncharacterized protein n=1 Tax=Senna tora TaxID=362788 RepID=A0A835CG24_9FABA|nr:uncharacterized protein G2W53_008708 [Senna tora]
MAGNGISASRFWWVPLVGAFHFALVIRRFATVQYKGQPAKPRILIISLRAIIGAF